MELSSLGIAKMFWIAHLFGSLLPKVESASFGNNFEERKSHPIVVNTWPFNEAAEKAWSVLTEGGSALDAVEQGCTKCEELQCDGTVGYGGSPDENGETTLDAMIMDGSTHAVGAVGALREVKQAISVARKVMEHTKHTMLVGSQATDFALEMGFTKASLTTPHSKKIHDDWVSKNCQPNFRKNVSPDPTKSCGPYSSNGNTWNGYRLLYSFYPDPATRPEFIDSLFPHLDDIAGPGKAVREKGVISHDTIGMIAMDSSGKIAGGTSTNGANHKVPGRVGDSPIAGSGAYVDQEIGGAAATGDGDVMMRFMPSLIAVENMRNGMNPDAASQDSLKRIVKRYPDFSGAVVSMTISGQHGASCYGLPSGKFQYCVGSKELDGVKIVSVPCIT